VLERLSAPLRLLPDFIIIGARCCGTTSLHAYLARHPEIRLPSKKELHFFDDHFTAGPSYYRSHFPWRLQKWRSERLLRRPFRTGEASPFYLYHPRVPERAWALCPQAKLIVLLRNPVDRAFSHYQQSRRDGVEPLSFEEALAAEPERIRDGLERLASGAQERGSAVKDFSYVSRGVYVDQLERWTAHFPREQLLVLPSERLFAEPAAVMEQVHAFLGVSPHRSESYRQLHAGKYAESMDPDCRRRLQDYFAPHNERLYRFVGECYGWEP